MTYKTATKSDLIEIANSLLSPYLDELNADLAEMRSINKTLRHEISRLENELGNVETRIDTKVKRIDGNQKAILRSLSRLEAKR